MLDEAGKVLPLGWIYKDTTDNLSKKTMATNRTRSTIGTAAHSTCRYMGKPTSFKLIIIIIIIFCIDTIDSVGGGRENKNSIGGALSTFRSNNYILIDVQNNK